MARRTFRPAPHAWRLACICLLLPCHLAAVSDDAVPDGGPLASWLEAGEFAAARQWVTSLPPGPEQDQALEQLARAQSHAGAHRAAVRTALSIRDDVQQHATLRQMIPAGVTMDAAGAGSSFAPGQPSPGGGSLADFDTLIELITTTVAPDTWEEVGGPGTIAGFPTGVLINTRRLLSHAAQDEELHTSVRNRMAAESGAVPERKWRKISLPRLEAALLTRLASGLPPTPEMLRLADLERIRYVVLYPEQHDLLLVGTVGETGGDWALSDLCVALHCAREGELQMVCAITPRPAGLAAIASFLDQSASTPLPPGRRARELWLTQLRGHLGPQDVQYRGLPFDTHAAQLLFAADYHMKLVGMGILPAVPGLASYLDSVARNAGDALPALEVLRWWFTLRPGSVAADERRELFELPAELVQVMSENELLSRQGNRLPTGAAEPLNRQFAAEFTREFPSLARRYPIYAQLENFFSLAVAAALVQREGLPERVHWSPTLLMELDPVLVPRAAAVREVESVIGHRLLDDQRILAGVSGGVDLHPARDLLPRTARELAYEAERIREDGQPRQDRHASVEAELTWWWD